MITLGYPNYGINLIIPWFIPAPNRDNTSLPYTDREDQAQEIPR